MSVSTQISSFLRISRRMVLLDELLLISWIDMLAVYRFLKAGADLLAFFIRD